MNRSVFNFSVSKYSFDMIVTLIVFRIVLFAVLYIPTVLFFRTQEIVYMWLSLYGAVNIINIVSVVFIAKKSKKDIVRYPMNVVQIILFALELSICTYIVYFTGGVMSGFVFLYIFTIIAASFFFSIYGGIFMSVIVVIIYGMVYYFQFKDMPYRVFYHYTNVLNTYYFNVISFFAIGFLTGFLARKIYISARLLEEKETVAFLGELSAKMIHEIKNPLSAVIGSAQMLETSTSKDRTEKLIELILKESRRIDKLMNNFFNVIKKKEPSVSSFDLSFLVREILESYSNKSEGENRRNWKLNIKSTSNIKGGEIKVESDRDLLAQMLINLIDNGFQVIEDKQYGFLSVTIDERSDTVIIEVRDNGGGIKESLYDKIFLPFISTKVRGSGLGLAICKNIADILKINIQYYNDTLLGEPGAVFRLHIPKFFIN